ncbi:hypothetical protein ACFCWG_44615 [Streptomyces sp. NPDC056390]
MITRYQKNASFMKHFFMPVNRAGYVARSTLMRVISNPLVAKIAKPGMR